MSSETISAQRPSKASSMREALCTPLKLAEPVDRPCRNLSCTLILNDVVCAAGQQEEAIEAL